LGLRLSVLCNIGFQTLSNKWAAPDPAWFDQQNFFNYHHQTASRWTLSVLRRTFSVVMGANLRGSPPA
jgi:hypothetical protein